MAKPKEKMIDLKVTFVDLKDDEKAPQIAVYQLDVGGHPVKKLGGYKDKKLKIDFSNVKLIAFGPDIDDFKTLPKKSLASYRVEQNIELWRKQGIVLPRNIWDCFYYHYVCVNGTVRKCRPWYWELIGDNRFAPMYELAQVARIMPISAEMQPHIGFPYKCLPMCDGIIEIYERECCCHHIHIQTLLDRLRELLEVLPIPIPDPPWDPIPGPDPEPFTPLLMRAKVRDIQRRKVPLDFAAIPSENLFNDYLTLRTMSADAARLYILERPYLRTIICHCTVRKVGQTPIKPGGKFDFCYRHIHYYPHYPLHYGHCFTTYAYKVKQLINGVLTTVYDGLAAHEYFSACGSADIKTYNPLAIVCADGPGDPPPNEGNSFVMLEHIGKHGTFHFNFPNQNGETQVETLDPNDGTYTTNDAPDCPWGGALRLRLWFSPELKDIVHYYRLKVFAVNEAGSPVGLPVLLNNTVTWDKLKDIPGDLIRVPETLGPVSVGAQNNLFKVPYWSSPNHRYMSGQCHQIWDTTHPQFTDGKYMLVIEVFNSAGNRIMPNGATGSETEQNFQFRRWVSAVDTDPVPFADMAHIFWIDNTPVAGDIVDLRKNNSSNDEECQFMTGNRNHKFAIGFRAFHENGVEHDGNGDNNSFMWQYSIKWQRGLNGAVGALSPPTGDTYHTDVGETGEAVTSGSETFENMLTNTATGEVLSKCTFSVTLRVHAKHFTGISRIQSYDYRETASFALEIT
ncbi:MAG: hypothetical protein KAR57_00850 [Bacteroidales bacterium]|nr:hypothetical protein [Bacteroidales bacterium]